MKIKSSLKKYSIQYHQNISDFTSFFSLENAYFVIDKKVYKLYKDELFFGLKSNNLYLLDAIEQNKTIETALEICEKMTEIPAKKNAHLISFGGGIVQDITGFVANILYRGIHWTFVPTTLLAACDSCIGGKTSLNYKSFKNLLGTFYPPDSIHICSAFFKTLTQSDFESGLGEVVKFNIMAGWDTLISLESDINLLLSRNSDKIDSYIHNSLEFKRTFIEEDEFDKGLRIYLNFAHTFGHAIETLTKYEIPHGTAVAMGTLLANHISLSRGLLDQKTATRIEELIVKIINININKYDFDIPTMLTAIRKDKKQTTTALNAILLCDNMKLVRINDLKKEELENSIVNMIKILNRK